MDTTTAIQTFLASRRLALVGVSRNPKEFSRALLRELVARGYDAVPVNAAADEIEGRPCFRSVGAIAPPVEAALLLTAPDRSAAAVRECLAAGVRRIWFHRGAGQGSLSPEALELCRQAGVLVVPGACAFMYLPKAGLPHRIHGFFHRLRRKDRGPAEARPMV
jgi:predicted CoA-binding protein